MATLQNTTIFSISEKEIEVLKMIRKQCYDRITIIKKDGQIDRFECTEKIERNKSFSEILAEADYQEILICRNDGSVTSIIRTIKLKASNS